MLRELSMQDYEKMASDLAERFAADPEQDLEDLTAKFACGQGMIPEQIRNLVHSLNNMVFLKLFDRDKADGKDPLGEFPVAQPENVIQKVLTITPDGVVEDADAAGGHDPLTDIHGDFPDLLRGGASPQGASVKITIEKVAEEEVEKVAEVSPITNLIRGQRAQDTLSSRKYACAFQIQEELEKLAYEMTRVGAPDLGRVKMLVEAVDNPFVKKAFSMTLAILEKDSEKIAAVRTPRVYNSEEHPLPSLKKIATQIQNLRVLMTSEQRLEEYVAAIPR